MSSSKDGPEKVDLKDINKKNRKNTVSLNVTSIKNIFNKKDTYKRDSDGKFTTGSGGLTRVKNFNWKRSAPILLVVALVGGFLVFQSFATSYGASVTAWYRACGYSNPPTSGANWQGWIDKIKANPANQSGVYAQFKAAAEATGKKCPASDPAPAATAATTTTGNPSVNAQQVTALYQEILGRTPSQADINYWVDRSKTMTAAQVRAAIEATDEAFKKNIAKRVTEAQAWRTLANAYVTNAQKENDATYKISTQEQVELGDLQTIARKEKYVRDAKGQVQGAATTIGQHYQRAQKLNLSQASELQGIVNSLSGSVRSLDGYIQNIAADYKRAEQKYESLLSFYDVAGRLEAEKIRCQANGGTWQWWRNYCQMPPPPPAAPAGGSGSSFGWAGGGGGSGSVDPNLRCLLNGSCGDNYPQYTMCRAKPDGNYKDYDYRVVTGQQTASGRAYQKRSRDVRCSRGGENHVSTWSRWWAITLDQYRDEQQRLGTGLH